MPARDRPRLRRRSVEPDARLASVLGATKACARARKRDAPRAGACVDNLLAVRPLEGRDLLKGTHELGLQPRRVRRLWDGNVNEWSGEQGLPALFLVSTDVAFRSCTVVRTRRGLAASSTGCPSFSQSGRPPSSTETRSWPNACTHSYTVRAMSTLRGGEWRYDVHGWWRTLKVQ